MYHNPRRACRLLHTRHGDYITPARCSTHHQAHLSAIINACIEDPGNLQQLWLTHQLLGWPEPFSTPAASVLHADHAEPDILQLLRNYRHPGVDHAVVTTHPSQVTRTGHQDHVMLQD